MCPYSKVNAPYQLPSQRAVKSLLENLVPKSVSSKIAVAAVHFNISLDNPYDESCGKWKVGRHTELAIIHRLLYRALPRSREQNLVTYCSQLKKKHMSIFTSRKYWTNYHPKHATVFYLYYFYYSFSTSFNCM